MPAIQTNRAERTNYTLQHYSAMRLSLPANIALGKLFVYVLNGCRVARAHAAYAAYAAATFMRSALRYC